MSDSIKSDATRCASCGVKWTDHAGIIQTCLRLAATKQRIKTGIPLAAAQLAGMMHRQQLTSSDANLPQAIEGVLVDHLEAK